MPPKTDSWPTGDPEWTISLSVPQGSGESNQDWCDRFDRIVEAAEAEFPRN